MLYSNVNTAYIEIINKLVQACDDQYTHYEEISRTQDKCTYLLPSSHEMTLDIEHKFPMLETRFVPFKSMVTEVLWYLTGSSSIQMLKDNNVKIWDHWATEEGELGPVYGVVWRNFKDSQGNTIDQIKNAIEIVKKHPNSRQNLVTAWDPRVLPDPSVTAQENVKNGKAALPPCHTFFRLRAHQDKYLSMHMFMR